MCIRDRVDGVDVAALNTTVSNLSTDIVSDTSPQLGGNLASNGNDILMADNDSIKVGSGNDLLIYHDSNNSYVQDNGAGDLFVQSQSNIKILAGDENSIICNDDGAVELYHDNSKKFETKSNGGKITGHLEIDGGTGQGTGDATLYVHSNGNQDWSALIDAATGDKSEYGLKVLSESSASYAFVNANVSGASHAHNFEINGSGHITKVGNITPRGNNSFDLGSTSLRWRNIYTNDLHLSNVGHTNDVDGTWGDWTIQEGESDLFLKNNRSGKKYKFNLTEVS